MRWGRRNFYMRKYSKQIQQGIFVFYQVLVPLIIFQFIRTLFFPSTFDMLLLGLLVVLYLANVYGWFSK